MLGVWIITRKGSGCWNGEHKTIDGILFCERIFSQKLNILDLKCPPNTRPCYPRQRGAPVATFLRDSHSNSACIPLLIGGSLLSGQPVHPGTAVTIRGLVLLYTECPHLSNCATMTPALWTRLKGPHICINWNHSHPGSRLLSTAQPLDFVVCNTASCLCRDWPPGMGPCQSA